MLVGLGTSDALQGDAGAESLRRGAAAFVRAAGTGGVGAVVVPDGLGVDDQVAAAAVAEGALLAAYRFTRTERVRRETRWSA